MHSNIRKPEHAIRLGYKGSSTGRRLATSHRTGEGQAIVESVVGLILIVTVGVGLILMLLNLYAAFAYKTKLDAVAYAVAHHAAQHRFWLGMEKPASAQLTKEQMEAEGKVFAEQMLHALGMPAVADVHLQVDHDTPEGIDGSTTVVVANVTVSGLKMPGGQCLPTVIQLTGSSIDAEASVSPYAECSIQVQIPKPDGSLRYAIVQLPAYCFITGGKHMEESNGKDTGANGTGIGDMGDYGHGAINTTTLTVLAPPSQYQTARLAVVKNGNIAQLQKWDLEKYTN